MSIKSAVQIVDATVGVAAKHMNTGEEICEGGGEVFFTASTFKIPILIELYKQIDAGVLSADSRMEITDRHRAPGSGVVKELSNGLNPTVHDLATLMIIISDNTATDMLYDLVGRECLNKTMQELGLRKTNLPMSCREMLYSMYGVETDDIGDAEAQVADRRSKEQVVDGALGASLDYSDVSSPNDMVKLLELLYGGAILSSSSRDSVLRIMARQQLNTIIPYLLPPGTRIAHKTGGVTGVRCDVGIVYAPSGPYAVAIMARDVIDRNKIDNQLAEISGAVYRHFES